ncbi:MAG: hypothetical protein HEQ32_01885 [Vampirovibrio sp.]
MLPLPDLNELFDGDEFAQAITWLKDSQPHQALCILQSPEMLVRLGILTLEDADAVAIMQMSESQGLKRDDIVMIDEKNYRITHALHDEFGLVRFGLTLNHVNDIATGSNTEAEEVFEWQ